MLFRSVSQSRYGGALKAIHLKPVDDLRLKESITPVLYTGPIRIRQMNNYLDGYDKQEKVYKCGSMDTSNIRNKRTYKLSQSHLDGYLNNLLKGGSVYDDIVNRGIRLATVIKYKLGLSYYKGKSWLLIPYDYNNNPVCSYKRIFRGDKGKEVMTSGKGVIYPLDVLYDNDAFVS